MCIVGKLSRPYSHRPLTTQVLTPTFGSRLTFMDLLLRETKHLPQRALLTINITTPPAHSRTVQTHTRAYTGTCFLTSSRPRVSPVLPAVSTWLCTAAQITTNVRASQKERLVTSIPFVNCIRERPDKPSVIRATSNSRGCTASRSRDRSNPNFLRKLYASTRCSQKRSSMRSRSTAPYEQPLSGNNRVYQRIQSSMPCHRHTKLTGSPNSTAESTRSMTAVSISCG
jgi:hypothetical protein|eukprot:COSAG01_NODE_4182_length_5262_cov_62.230292_6_plen_227_part_00